MYRDVFGQPSWGVRMPEVEFWVTERGGHLAPATFRLPGREFQPFAVAPWAEEETEANLPQMLRSLRGDFFCMPFGANDEPYGSERHPPHGETANRTWTLKRIDDDGLELELESTVRPGRITKRVFAKPGQRAIYCEHVIDGMSGAMSFGHHATLSFREPGEIAIAPFALGMVYPGQFENPALGGYSSLRPGARFDRLSEVPIANGGIADLTKYPAREGFEDLAQVWSPADTRFGWTAVGFSGSRALYLQLKDCRKLSGTLLWHSNGGRHYAPWNGRHRAVLGLEEITSFFHDGLAKSVAPNPASDSGLRTYFELDNAVPLSVRTVTMILDLPADFGTVVRVEPEISGIVAIDDRGTMVREPVDSEFPLD